MDKKDFKEVSQKSVQLYGFAINHLFEEDAEYEISKRLINSLKNVVEDKTVFYLVKNYDDFLETGERITFVGAENIIEQEKPLLESIIIPESKYLKVGFSNDKEDSDEIYSRCYEYFECNDILHRSKF